MATSRYRLFLRLCERWGVDEGKKGRDLGALVRTRVASGFKLGDASEVDSVECDRVYSCLTRIQNDTYRKQYLRTATSSATGLTSEELQIMNSTDTQEYFKTETLSFMDKLRGGS